MHQWPALDEPPLREAGRVSRKGSAPACAATMTDAISVRSLDRFGDCAIADQNNTGSIEGETSMRPAPARRGGSGCGDGRNSTGPQSQSIMTKLIPIKISLA